MRWLAALMTGASCAALGCCAPAAEEPAAAATQPVLHLPVPTATKRDEPLPAGFTAMALRVPPRYRSHSIRVSGETPPAPAGSEQRSLALFILVADLLMAGRGDDAPARGDFDVVTGTLLVADRPERLQRVETFVRALWQSSEGDGPPSRMRPDFGDLEQFARTWPDLP